MEKVLTGIRVLDFSRWFAGPYAATLLAAMGADVVRVERPTGEEERNFGPFAPNGESMLTMVTLANRRGVTLDPLSEREGKSCINSWPRATWCCTATSAVPRKRNCSTTSH